MSLPLLDLGSDVAFDDLLAAALSSTSIDPADAVLEGRFQSGRHLARAVAPLLDVTEADLWDALTYLPDGLLHLLDTPEGWSALVPILSADLGVKPARFTPSVH